MKVKVVAQRCSLVEIVDKVALIQPEQHRPTTSMFRCARLSWWSLTTRSTSTGMRSPDSTCSQAAAFLIENPGNAGDMKAMNLAAVESVLKMYSVILRQKPDARSKLLDDLLKKQNQGKLEDTLRERCQ